MWRELIQDDKSEGCLLAHTMGLGKTMQVYVVAYSSISFIQSELQELIVDLVYPCSSLLLLRQNRQTLQSVIRYPRASFGHKR
jgi:SNF2 family DNA or RNA helicase